jgi:DNA processing protein
MDECLPWLRLHMTPGLGRAAIFRLIGIFGDPATALAEIRQWDNFTGLRRHLAAQVPDASDARLHDAGRRLQECGARPLTFWDTDYPELLRKIPDPPAILYVRGRMEPAGRRLAIVGSRQPTPGGRNWTRRIAAEVADHGITIVSGLARGIDAAAHQGGLTGSGGTIAVLGSGIDRIYPPEHARLADEITERGAILSEYPPGVAPLPGHFPGRNRIISGLCQGVLVVEAKRDSGSLITAEFALEQGREVLAVPGGIDRATSAGTNQLIKEGAHPVTEFSDLLTIPGFGPCVGHASPVGLKPIVSLPDSALEVLKLLDAEPRHIDELAGKSGLTPMALSAILLHLELEGGAESLPGARYVRGSRALFHP